MFFIRIHVYSRSEPCISIESCAHTQPLIIVPRVHMLMLMLMLILILIFNLV